MRSFASADSLDVLDLIKHLHSVLPLTAINLAKQFSSHGRQLTADSVEKVGYRLRIRKVRVRD
jgi:hypothetical protein